MDSSQVPSIDLHAVYSDFAAALSSQENTVTEFSVAAKGGSSFNRAFYLDELTPEILQDIAMRQENVAFLPFCQSESITGVLNTVIKRQAKASCIQSKSIVSFDLDFKDCSIKPDMEEILSTLKKHKVPVWLVCFSGNGLHFHFKLDKPISTKNSIEYRKHYHTWREVLEGVLELPLDKSCSNIARSMRLPGSTNWKDKHKPIQGKVVYFNPQVKADSFFEPLTLSCTQKKKTKHLSLEKVFEYFKYSKTDSMEKIGDQIRCSSPFSSDSTPSFYFHTAKSVFYDFSSGFGGGVYELVAKLAKLDPKKDHYKISSHLKKLIGNGAKEAKSFFSLRDNGIWFSKPIGDGEDKEELWICSKLMVTAYSKDLETDTWGMLLEFYDYDEKRKTWLMPMDFLAGDGTELRKELLKRGVKLSQHKKARFYLLDFLQNSAPLDRVKTVQRIGWHDECYVLPSEIYRKKVLDQNERIFFHSSYENENYKSHGTLEGWKERVAVPSVGHSRLLFALSAAFCPPLLYLRGEESGGIHFVGPSSIGKTLALRIAGSVWGGGGISGFMRKWRSTVNGLELLAKSRCDSLLLLDEIAEIPAKEAAAAAYMLANGSGKKRLDRNGSLLPSHEWRILFLSSGEVSLANHLAEAGESLKGGQLVRLVEVDADAGQGFGVFSKLEEGVCSQLLAESLKRATQHYYGTAIEAYLGKLLKEENLQEKIDRYFNQFMKRVSDLTISRQVRRVANRFGLIAASGALASEFNILPCSSSDIFESAQDCFKVWASSHSSHGDFETSKILSHMRKYLQVHGCSQFPEWDGKTKPVFTGKCSGYRLVQKKDKLEWLILGEVFRSEIFKGFELKKVISVLKSSNFLVTSKNGKSTMALRLPHFGPARVYHIRGDILSDI